MKTTQNYKLLILSVLFFGMIKVHAQDEFVKRLSEARAAFAANKLGIAVDTGGLECGRGPLS